MGESLSFWQIIGTVLIISAILTATHHGGNHSIQRRDLILGITFGILAMVTVAVSIVSVKPLLERSSLIWVSEIRLIGGVLVLLIVLMFHPARRKIVSSVMSIRHWGYTLSGSFVGAYIALVFWLAGMKYTQASEAAALNQTSSIFIFILAAIFLKESITLRRIIGIVLAVSGAFMVMFG